jgi:putative transcriptional regulator
MNKTGTLLIAPPNLRHPLWESTTILVTEDNSTGTTGIILNKESQMTIAEFGERLGVDLEHVPGMLHIGGPDRQTSFSILHTSEWSSRNTFAINEHFSISSDNEVLKKFEIGDEPNQWRMFLGMCTWMPGQLENEMRGSSSVSWCTSTCDNELIFETSLEEVWDNAIERCSLEFAQNFML